MSLRTTVARDGGRPDTRATKRIISSPSVRARGAASTRAGPCDIPSTTGLVVFRELARSGVVRFGQLGRAIPGNRTKALTLNAVMAASPSSSISRNAWTGPGAGPYFPRGNLNGARRAVCGRKAKRLAPRGGPPGETRWDNLGAAASVHCWRPETSRCGRLHCGSRS